MGAFAGTKFSLGAEYISGKDDTYEITNYNEDKVVKASFIDNVFDDMVRVRQDNLQIFIFWNKMGFRISTQSWGESRPA